MTFSRRDLLRGNFTAVYQSPVASETAVSDPILHLLQRLTYGPRPADVAAARAMGYEAYLEAQLNPEQLPDETADALLRNLPILHMARPALYRLQDSAYRCQQAQVKGMIIRAAHSERQLLERMVEFWADHFNVHIDGWPEEMVVYLRETIRPHALGRFRDLLLATAQSPAMLYYLDNYINTAGAPNENYAREVMELHTLGVDGGYTEQDVAEVARAFTGWTVHNGTRTGFYFDPATHDTDAKMILGHAFPVGRGIEDGLHVLSLLAVQPATARYVCRKLAVRFVSDEPPTSLVDRLTAVWQQTDGDMRSILRALFLSAEFQGSAGQKLRRPLDFFIGALRATGARIHDDWQQEEMLRRLGQPPYGWSPPNGYPDAAGAWLNTGGLLARWNVAMLLTHSAYEESDGDGYHLSAALHEQIGPAETVGDLVDAVATRIWGAPLQGRARAEFVLYTADGGSAETAVTPHLLARKLGTLYGLMLASPYFQWR